MADSLKTDLARIRAARKAARPHHFRPSKLDPHRHDIERLAELGASLEEIRVWLQQRKKLAASKSTIARAIRRWREIAS